MSALGLLRRVTPKPLRRAYHAGLATLAAVAFGHPTRGMIVIGITGTSGKTTTALLLHAMLERAGHSAALATTAEFAIGGRRWPNDLKMTMPGRFRLQRFLRLARSSGCTHAIVETTSEGILQHRHRGLDYDLVLLTNLSPEHLESHGSFAAYQAAKEQLFRRLTLTRRKSGVVKTSIVNADDPAAPAFARYPADRRLSFSLGEKRLPSVESVFARKVVLTSNGSSFQLAVGDRTVDLKLHLLGRANVENAVAAATAATALGVSTEIIAQALAGVTVIPGRFEMFRRGGVTAIVDYAFHPQAMTELYAVVGQLVHRRILHVLGGTGGGRDRARRPVLGRMAGDLADIVIVTNEDPYDENPESIVDDVLGGVMLSAGKRLGQNAYRILDRGQAIAKAAALAEPGDVILITGKGSERAIVVSGGRHIPWDDRQVVQSSLNARFPA